MAKIGEKFMDGMSTVAEKMDGNKHLSVIKNTFAANMGFVIVGSFATLFNTILCSTTTGLAQIAAFSFLTAWSPVFTAINYACVNLMAVFVTFMMGVNYGKRNNVNSLHNGVLCVITMLVVSPTFTTLMVEGTAHQVKNVLPAAVTNSANLFTGMILSILISELFAKLMSFDKIKIKMPPQVPSNIASSFNSLIPMAIAIFAAGAVGGLVRHVSGNYLNEIIYKVVQVPLQKVGGSAPGVLLFTFTALLFWCIGIHGNQLINPITGPIMAANLATNLELAAAGQAGTEIFTGALWVNFITLTGSGVTMALILSILVFSKREDYRGVAKIGLVPGIFGVNEPIIFGLPIVLNPLMAIPFVCSGLVAAGISYFACSIGFFTPNVLSAPWGLPAFLNAFVAYGQWQAVATQVIVLAVCFLIYTPFVKAANRQYEKEVAASIEQ